MIVRTLEYRRGALAGACVAHGAEAIAISDDATLAVLPALTWERTPIAVWARWDGESWVIYYTANPDHPAAELPMG